MYKKTWIGVGFDVHTSPKTMVLAVFERGMYTQKSLAGKYCVHIRYVPPKKEGAKERNTRKKIGFLGCCTKNNFLPDI